MAVIDVGCEARDRPSQATTTYTMVPTANPANDTGKITSVEIWMYSTGSNVEVATFIHAGSNVLSTRDRETLGSVTAGSKQTFSGLDMDVQTGDYIGCHGTAGSIEYTNNPSDLWSKSGDYIPCTSETFPFVTINRAISLYGIGATPPVGWTGKISGVTNPAKIMGVEVANIAKVKGVA